MNYKKLFLAGILIFALLVTIYFAVATEIFDNLDMSGKDVFNATYVNCTYIVADGSQLTNINATATSMNWTGLQNYPAACSANQYVSAVGDTLTCSTPSASSIAWSGITDFPAACSAGNAITQLNTSVTCSAFLQNIVEDTTPQLGGYLDANGQNIGSTDDEIENIYVGDNTRIYFGDDQDVSIYYNGTHFIVTS